MSSYWKFLSRNKLYSIIEAVGLGVSMAFLSVLWQTLKAALTNPAEALKKE